MDTRRALVNALESGPVSGPELADRLDVSRAAVWKHVEALRTRGFAIESGSDGYSVTGTPEYGAAAIQYGLNAPYQIEFHETIGSTNDRARELAEDGHTDIAVLADEQTGGRGRLDREWTAPAGGIYLSVVIRPDLAPAQAPIVTLAAAVAVVDACRIAGIDAQIKWPNDVLIPDSTADRGGIKLAGVLTEMRGEADRVSWIAVGIGLNANIDTGDLPHAATSLRVEAGNSIDRRRITQTLLERFAELTASPKSVLPAWRDRAATIGQDVRIETATKTIHGTAIDVEFPGALVVETDGKTETVLSGDCTHLRPAE